MDTVQAIMFSDKINPTIFLFVCIGGNWDIKTKIPEQYVVAGMELPPYFMEWINLKDVYLNFYNSVATGMVPMLSQLKMQVLGTHHVGIDDTRNIARVLQRLIIDGSILQITGRKKKDGKVEYLFNKRIKYQMDR